ncbi:hypothetical protein DPMN_075895 [Dreissena polymorpha]|uniref:Uncharacterized protein n=1 Tax=Dreissena polymorpha TaxID=45954 RepID=A0A9D3YLD3_DREPO|nr:hypothetical protein DPMN_075895 [Dreissena polymorpha]
MSILQDPEKCDRQTHRQTDTQSATLQPTQNKHNPRLRHGQKFSTRRPCQVFTRRIAEALGINPRNDAEPVLTSSIFAE